MADIYDELENENLEDDEFLYIDPEEEKQKELLDTMLSIKNNYKRRDDLLEETLNEIVTTYPNSLKIEDLKNILNENGFNGIYVIDDDIHLKIAYDDVNTAGMYLHLEKIIITTEKNIKSYKAVLIHEIGHALIDSKMDKNFTNNKIGGLPFSIHLGKGIEEGLVSMFEIKYLDRRKKYGKTNNIYYYQTKILQQLDVLYKFYSKKKYENIFVHALLEPKNFVYLIQDMYKDLLLQKAPNGLEETNRWEEITRDELITTSCSLAYDTITICDKCLECFGINDEGNVIAKELFAITTYINAILVSLFDKKIIENFDNYQYKGVFIKEVVEAIHISRETKFLCSVFGYYSNYDIELIRGLYKASGLGRRYEDGYKEFTVK